MRKGKSAALCQSLLWGLCILLFPIFSGVLSAVLSLEAVETLFLQGFAMLLSLLVPLVPILRKKWTWSEIGFAGPDGAGCRKAVYFLPLLAVFIPAAVGGFSIKSPAYVWGNLLLYAAVGLAEEVYFRGVIPRALGRAFSTKEVVILSSLLFGIGHIASAFTADSGWEVLLTTLNACIFGWLAIEMAMICGNIVPCVLFHFMFDFETKIAVLGGDGLRRAEWLRGALMVAAALWLMGILEKWDSSRGKIFWTKYPEIPLDKSTRLEYTNQGDKRRPRGAARKGTERNEKPIGHNDSGPAGHRRQLRH